MIWTLAKDHELPESTSYAGLSQGLKIHWNSPAMGVSGAQKSTMNNQNYRDIAITLMAQRLNPEILILQRW
jgi:hypothetical protein